MTWLPQTFGGKEMSLFFKEVWMIAKAKNGQASIWDLSKLNFIATCNIWSPKKQDSEKNMILCKKGDDITPFDGKLISVIANPQTK
jgi:hypothetical protein